MEVVRDCGTRENTFFFHVNDGFYYHKSQTRVNAVYFKCIKNECNGRAVYRRQAGFRHTGRHNHPPDIYYHEEMAMRRACKRACRNMEYNSYAEIINRIGSRFSVEVRSRVTPANMRATMRRERINHFPPIPRSMRGLRRRLQDPLFSHLTLTEDGEDNVYAGSVVAADNSQHTIFTSTRLLRFMANMSTLQSDGTFKCLPSGLGLRQDLRSRNCAQIFTIVTSWRHTVLPLAWVIMEHRTQAAYEAVLEHIRLLLQQMGLQLSATTVICDFETALMNAWQTVFGIDPQGCLYHSDRAFIRKARKLNLGWHMKNDPDIKRLVRTSCAIPLLPYRLMYRGLLMLTRECIQGNQINLMRPYLRYLNNTWIRNRIKRRRLCVFKSKRRTNNACETHNRILNKLMGIHPNIYIFIVNIVRLEARTWADIQGLNNFRRVGRARKSKSIANDASLARAAEDILDPPDNINQAVWRYMRRASHIMQNVFNEAAGVEDEV